MANPELQRLTDEIIELMARANPVWATEEGIHDYDDQLPDISESHREERLAGMRRLEQQLNALDSDGQLSEDDAFDCKALLCYLHTDIIEEAELKRTTRDPNLPLQLAMSGCHEIVTGDFAPPPQRFASLAGRLEQVPRLLRQAAENLVQLDTIPAVWAEMAEDSATTALIFFGGMIPKAAREVPELFDSVVAASKLAAEACFDYREFLERELTSRSSGTYACGREIFERLLAEQHLLDYGSAELLEIGEQAVESTIAEMERVAASMDRGRSWKELVDQLKNDHPPADKLLDSYKTEVDKLREFVLASGLVSLPDDDELDVVETPEFSRPLLPFAAYVHPGPFDNRRKGTLWVTPIRGDASPERQQEQLRGQNWRSLRLIALHETYPGHHLQLSTAVTNKSKIRRVGYSSLFAEGWALYCEELLIDEGCYSDRGIRLMQLLHQLWRACRVVIDAKLHTGQMTFTEAVKMLMEIVDVDYLEAVGEVKRYTQSPTQPMSYLIGKLEILRLREESRRRLGARFGMRSFHDKLLSYGTVPFGLIADKILEQKP